MSELLLNLLDKDLLADYNPKESGTAIEFIIESYKMTLFDFSIRGDWPWSVNLVLEKEDGEAYHDTVKPQSGRDRREFLWRIEQDLPDMKGPLQHFFEVLVHSYNRARRGVTEEVLEVHTGKESLDHEAWPLEKQREVISGFAVERGYTHLFGDAKIGKSIIAHLIGLHAACGRGFLGFPATLHPVKVLYVSLEMAYNEFRERHEKLLESFSETAEDNFYFACPPYFDFSTERDRSLLVNLVIAQGIELIIMDSHSGWRGDLDPSDNGEIGGKIVTPMLSMLKTLDCSLILIDHTPWKGDRPSGAKSLWNQASIGILMERLEDDSRKISFKGWRSTARPTPAPIKLAYNPETYMVERTEMIELDELLIALELPAKPSKVVKQIQKIKGVKERQAQNIKSELLKIGYLSEMEDGQLFSIHI